MQKNKIKSLFFNFIFSVFLVVFIINLLVFAFSFYAIKELPACEGELLRVKIYGNSELASGDTVSASISIIDWNGNECAVIERSWKGSYISADFLCADLYGKKIYFPYYVRSYDRILQKKKIMLNENGTNLYRYYVENGRCYLSGYDKASKMEKKMYVLAVFLKSPLVLFTGAFRKIYTVNLFQCENGVFYGVYADEKGNLELRKD